MTSCDITNNYLFKEINLNRDHCFTGTDSIDQNMFFCEILFDKSAPPIHKVLKLGKIEN